MSSLAHSFLDRIYQLFSLIFLLIILNHMKLFEYLMPSFRHRIILCHITHQNLSNLGHHSSGDWDQCQFLIFHESLIFLSGNVWWILYLFRMPQVCDRAESSKRWICNFLVLAIHPKLFKARLGIRAHFRIIEMFFWCSFQTYFSSLLESASRFFRVFRLLSFSFIC